MTRDSHQLTVRWGDDIVCVRTVDARRGFIVGRDFALDVEPVLLTETLVVGDFRFELERLVPTDTRPSWRPDVRLAVALVIAVAAHATAAWLGSTTVTDPAQVGAAQLATMRAYLQAADASELERELANTPPDNDPEGGIRGCGTRAKPESCDPPPRNVRPHVAYWDKPLTQDPSGPTGCGDFGDFFACADACMAGPMTMHPALSSRVVTESLGVPHGHLGRSGPTVRISAVSVKDDLSKADVARAVTSALPEITRWCYRPALQANPDLEMSVRATLVVRRQYAQQMKISDESVAAQCAMRLAGRALGSIVDEDAHPTVDITLTFTPP